MRILLHHPVKLPVTHYGGTERVTLWLARGLVERGHQVTLWAAPGSQNFSGIEVFAGDETDLPSKRPWDIYHGMVRPTDRVRNYFDGKTVCTVQGNGRIGETFDPNTVFVSRNHAERNGATAFVYNGLDPAELKFDTNPRADRFLFLSRTAWSVKNVTGAIRICRRAKKPLWVAGGERPWLARAEVELRSWFSDWRWVGSVNQAQKADFFVSGKAFVFPLAWHEPFGIVVTESLVSGTPVIAHPFGSLPELLEFAPQCLVDPFQDQYAERMNEVVLNSDRWPKADECRKWVLSKFSKEKMVADYLGIYEKVIAGEVLNSSIPKTITESRVVLP